MCERSQDWGDTHQTANLRDQTFPCFPSSFGISFLPLPTHLSQGYQHCNYAFSLEMGQLSWQRNLPRGRMCPGVEMAVLFWHLSRVQIISTLCEEEEARGHMLLP